MRSRAFGGVVAEILATVRLVAQACPNQGPAPRFPQGRETAPQLSREMKQSDIEQIRCGSVAAASAVKAFRCVVASAFLCTSAIGFRRYMCRDRGVSKIGAPPLPRRLCTSRAAREGGRLEARRLGPMSPQPGKTRPIRPFGVPWTADIYSLQRDLQNTLICMSCLKYFDTSGSNICWVPSHRS